MRSLLALTFLVVLPLLAAAADPQIGDEVFVKPNALAMKDEVAVDIDIISFPATVGKIRGESLWLGRAWVSKSDVMSVDEALSFYSQQINRNPKDANGWLKRGAVWLEKKVPANAIIDLTEAIRLEPTGSAGYNNRALAYLEVGDLDMAIKDHNQAVKFDPNNSKVINNRGITWQRKGDIDNSIKDHSEAVKLDPKNPVAYLNRGAARSAKQEFKKSIQDYNEAIRLDPYFSLAYDNRGISFHEIEDFDSAIADFSESIRLNPNVAKPYHNRACVLQKKGEGDKAFQDYSEAIRLDSALGEAFDGRGIIWTERGEYQNAIKDFMESIRLNPNDAHPYNNLAWVRATCPDQHFRDGNAAIENGTKACEISKWNTWNHVGTLAAAYAEAEDFTNAIKWGMKAVEIAPADKRQGAIERLKLYRENKPYRDMRKKSSE